MFGRDVFPTTRWDDQLNRQHLRPDFQPLEYLVAGRYMSEIVRLILAEASMTADLFGGQFPLSLADEYSLGTHTLAAIHQDTSESLSLSCQQFQKVHPLSSSSSLSSASASSPSPSFSDMRFIRQVIRSVSYRSVAYVTAGIHALTGLLDEIEAGAPDDQHQHPRPRERQHYRHHVGCDGSVITKYPGYMTMSQEMLDQLIALDVDRNGPGQAGKREREREREPKRRRRNRVVLDKTDNSTLLGAGVACALVFGG